MICVVVWMVVCVQRLQLSVFDEGNRGYLQVAQLHRFLEAMVPTAPMLQSIEVSTTTLVQHQKHAAAVLRGRGM